MATFILLTAEQAEHVRGPSINNLGSALHPVEHAGGVFILGDAVIADPAHSAHHEFLSTLPQMDSADPDFPPSLDPMMGE